MAELFLGQIPEAIYFALFMIYAKNLKEKRLLFTFLMIAEYIILKYFIHFNIWFQVLYTAMTFIILKILYKEKAQITDVFTFTIGSVLLMFISIICLTLVYKLTNSVFVTVIVNRISMFVSLFVLHNRLYKIQGLYKKLWNRNDKVEKKMKSATFRCINLLVFNVMFYIINISMVYCILLREWGVFNG